MGYEMKRGKAPRYMDLGSECVKCGQPVNSCPECETPIKDKDPKSGLIDLTGRPTEHDDTKVDLTKKTGKGPRETKDFDYEKYSDLEKSDYDRG